LIVTKTILLNNLFSNLFLEPTGTEQQGERFLLKETIGKAWKLE